MLYIHRVLSIYRREGFWTLLKMVFRKLYSDSYYSAISIRGHYSISIEDSSVQFSAPTSSSVKRNKNRFNSENQELRDFLREIKADDTVYDIGANTGLYTLFAAKKCHQGHVIAFEPYQPNLDSLYRDIERNDLDNVTVVETALSDAVGEIEFNQPDEADIGFGSSSIDVGDADSTETVPTTTGDQLVADGEIPPANVVKIDVEGAETLVIEGMTNTLSNSDCRAVFCEVHLPGHDIRPSIEDFGVSPSDLQARLEELGFSVQRIQTHQGPEILFKATK